MLNEYAEAVRARLVAIFPEFTGHVSEEDGALVIRYPSSDPEYPLCVYAWDDEITVGFDHWHMHLRRLDDDEGAELQSAEALIRAIREDRELVVVKHAGERWVGSHLASSPDEVRLERGETATVRAFSGLVARLGPAEARTGPREALDPAVHFPLLPLKDVPGVWTGLPEITHGSRAEALDPDCLGAFVRLFAPAESPYAFIEQVREFFEVFGAALVEVTDVEPYRDLLAREETDQEHAELALEAKEHNAVRFGTFHCFSSDEEE